MNEKLMLFYQKKANNYCSSFLQMNGVKKHIVVVMVFIPGQGLAWTDGQAIYINLAHKHFDGMSEEEVYLSVLGLTAHEAAHCIFTDFGLRTRCAKEWSTGIVKTIPAALSQVQSENRQKIVTAMSDRIKRRFMTETLLELDNIIEDGYIEDRCYEVRPGILLDALEYVRNRHFDQTIPVETAAANNSALKVFYSIVLMYVKYAYIKTTGEATPESTDLLETTSRCLPYLDKALSSKNSYFRKKMMIGVVLEAWEIFEKELEQLPTEQEVERFLNELREMLKEAMSQPGEGQSNSEQVAKDNLTSSSTEEADEQESQEEKRERAKKQIQEMMKKAADKTQEESSQEQSDGEQSEADADSGETSDEAGNGDGESKSADGEEDGDQSEADSDGDGESTDSGETSDEAGNSKGEQSGKEQSADTDSGKSSDESGDGDSEGESTDNDSSGSQDQSSSTDNKSGGSDESSSESSDTDSTDTSQSESTGDEGTNSDEAASEESAQVEESIRKALEKLAEELKEHDEEPEEAEEPQKQERNQKEPLDLQAEADLIDYGKVHKDVEINVSMQRVDGRNAEYRKHMLPAVKKSTQAVVNGLKNFFKNSDKGERQTGLMTGRRVDTRIAHRLDGKIMSAKKEPRPGVAIGILIDRSGSMSGSRLDIASYTALVFNRMCKELKLNLGVFTHCSNFGVEITCCKNYGEISPQDEQRIMSIEPCGCNRDGAALTYVGERLLKQPEETKMLILVCDGRPADAGYSGDIAKKDLQLIKRKLTRQGVKLVVAAIGEDKEQIKEIYGNSFINISNIESLPKTMVRELVRVLVANQ